MLINAVLNFHLVGQVVSYFERAERKNEFYSPDYFESLLNCAEAIQQFIN